MCEGENGKTVCGVCPHRCVIPEGGKGKCGARGTKNGRNIPLNYGTVSSAALDPVEKKPLKLFHPGRMIFSVGGFGCNMNCPFCQNWEISVASCRKGCEEEIPGCTAPEELAEIAFRLRDRGNIGIAFTYNEPLINLEYVTDTAKLVRKRRLKTVLVTNGCATMETADRVLPFIDALNIDLKSFQKNIYSDVLGGDLDAVQNFISEAVLSCHVELTSLIVPGLNDTEEEMRNMTEWIASLPGGEDIPLHVTRFFPRYRMTDREATSVGTVLRLTEIAGERLHHVFAGNL
ncbi:MAG: AmmeMemoRadiSam system radical SAM enzyme [Clostridia bacterium]|nr:AmmeMemoRadiSam system radical SAM enzyme [Clostridia bacterium]